MRLPRHTTFARDPRQLALQAGESARDTLEALRARLPVRAVTVALWAAVGSTSARIPLGAGGRPLAVTLGVVAKAYAQDEPVTCTPTLNFVWDSTTNQVDVFEPSGLTANTYYRFTFLVWEEG